MKKILLVDDDPELRQLLATYLGRHGLDVLLLPDTRQLDAYLERYQPHLVVLDLMMPGEDGLAACRRLRGRGETVPVIMLTARDEPVDRVVGLEMGADDYVGKPFRLAELMARVRAHPATDEAWQATRRRALRNEATVHRLRDACDVLDEHVAVNEGWISREVGWAVLVAFWLATFFWRTVGGVLVVVLAGGLLAWRAWPLFRLTGEIHRLGRELQGRRGGR